MTRWAIRGTFLQAAVGLLTSDAWATALFAGVLVLAILALAAWPDSPREVDRRRVRELDGRLRRGRLREVCSETVHGRHEQG